MYNVRLVTVSFANCHPLPSSVDKLATCLPAPAQGTYLHSVRPCPGPHSHQVTRTLSRQHLRAGSWPPRAPSHPGQPALPCPMCQPTGGLNAERLAAALPRLLLQQEKAHSSHTRPPCQHLWRHKCVNCVKQSWRRLSSSEPQDSEPPPSSHTLSLPRPAPGWESLPRSLALQSDARGPCCWSFSPLLK